MVVNVSRNGQKTIFWMGCACVGAYVAYRYWRKREFKAIDEGFEEVSKIDDSNERRILLLGLDGAGKTSVMNQAVAADTHGTLYKIPPAPTHGFAVYRLKNGPYTYNIWEIGGAEDTRTYWSNFLQDTDLLIFMVDASNATKLSLAVSTLKQLLGDPRMDNVPILVVANKQDVQNSLKPEQVKEALDLRSISPHKHRVVVIGCQTRPLPEILTNEKEYNWHHSSVDEDKLVSIISGLLRHKHFQFVDTKEEAVMTVGAVTRSSELYLRLVIVAAISKQPVSRLAVIQSSDWPPQGARSCNFYTWSGRRNVALFWIRKDCDTQTCHRNFNLSSSSEQFDHERMIF